MPRCYSRCSTLLVVVVLALTNFQCTKAFELPKVFGLPKISFGNDKGSSPPPFSSPLSNAVLEKQKQELLNAVSFTNNGKTATPEQQVKVLSLVGQLEKDYPPSSEILSDLSVAQILDGKWYLQYTSPSEVKDDDTPTSNKDQFPDVWKPQYEKEESVETAKFTARGSISAVGIEVETANRVVEQNLDVSRSRVTNVITLDWGKIQVGGTYKPSLKVPNRALVQFDTALIDVTKFGNPLSFNLGFVFPIIRQVSGKEENGWLETSKFR